MKKLKIAPEHQAAHAKLGAGFLDYIINSADLALILALVLPRVLATIKNANSKQAQALKAVLVPFARAVLAKFAE